MLPKRENQDDEALEGAGMLAAMETARSATESSQKEKPKSEESLSVFWRVFGGTILSIAALVVITIYNNMSSSVNDLRNELSREREARAELVKKDEFNSRVTAQYERMRAIDAVKVELEGMKEKVSANSTEVMTMKKDTAAAVDGVKKDMVAAADLAKKDAGALDLLKERVTAVEALKKDLAALDALKEKLTAAVLDLKTLREDVAKVTAAIERNKTSDLERKAFRDTQAKQLEDSLKEVQKGLQDCREKLARLEGSKPSVGPEKPMAKVDEK
jgi:chromosome segregation ATPase